MPFDDHAVRRPSRRESAPPPTEAAPPPEPGSVIFLRALPVAFVLLVMVGLGFLFWWLTVGQEASGRGDRAGKNVSRVDDDPAPLPPRGGEPSAVGSRQGEQWAHDLLGVLDKGGVWSQVTEPATRDQAPAVNSYIVVNAPLEHCYDVAARIENWASLMPRTLKVQPEGGAADAPLVVRITERREALRVRNPAALRGADVPAEAPIDASLGHVTYTETIRAVPNRSLSETLSGTLNGQMVMEFWSVDNRRRTVIQYYSRLSTAEPDLFLSAAAPAGNPEVEASLSYFITADRLRAVQKAAEESYRQMRAASPEKAWREGQEH
ncbi:MAG: hypothetical protein HY719_15705 [Planctomycetes bacterium]|nr:hypothetical protein [Planctomycetota bacterium]